MHYAGEVEYCAKGFVEKNKDKLPKEAVELLGSSSSPYVGVLQGRMKTYFGEHRQRANSIANRSVGSQFAGQLRKLNEIIGHTRPHYIRCLKVRSDEQRRTAGAKRQQKHNTPSYIIDKLSLVPSLLASSLILTLFAIRFAHRSRILP